MKQINRDENLSYIKKTPRRMLIGYLERVKRIELSQSAWKAEVLPLNYTRIFLWPSDVLLSHLRTTLGAKELNFCVRYGNRCALLALITRPSVRSYQSHKTRYLLLTSLSGNSRITVVKFNNCSSPS